MDKRSITNDRFLKIKEIGVNLLGAPYLRQFCASFRLQEKARVSADNSKANFSTANLLHFILSTFPSAFVMKHIGNVNGLLEM